jgi:hypothetical protein
MSRSETVLSLLLALSFTACAASHPPVPMVGAASDVSALVGEWSGDYSSAESGRAGSVSFTLRAAADSAFGDVIMVPSGTGKPLVPWRPQDQTNPGAQVTRPTGANQSPQTSVLTIRFVRVESGHVSGTLAPYADPQSGARLLTTFTGELKGNSIAGSYSTLLPSGETQTGRWSVERRTH